MRLKLSLCGLLVVFLLLIPLVGVWANLAQYTYSYDISQIEWQLLNWTVAWRGTTTPAAPFILERMDFDRRERIIKIYVNGLANQASEDNLKESIDKINANISQRFSEFDPKSDLVVYYSLGAASYEYINGGFKDTTANKTPKLESVD
ncbi:hypothetical protein D4R78_07165 [bacterium]|nr:MAG: hypothetical protein D4R78_07165 [bacterium]